MEDIFFVDRATGEVKREEVYGEKFVKWAYQDGGTSLSRRLLFHNPLLSNLLGWYFGSGLSRRRIAPAIEQLAIYEQAVRPTEVICWMHLPGISGADAMRSVELFAREVMPHFA